MSAIFIKNHGQEDEGFLILYAYENTNPMGCRSNDWRFQWYLSEDETSEGRPIKKGIGLLHMFSTIINRERGYTNHYVYCVYEHIHTGEVLRTEPFWLGDTFPEMVAAGMVFDKVDSFDKHGNL